MRMKKGSGPMFRNCYYDYRGSTIALTDTNGNVTDRIQYSAYGMTTARAGTNDTPFLYNGKYGVQTDTNGLLYMRARFYNPYICRFINADPSGWGGGMNFYAFANGNPISDTDPFGLGALDIGSPTTWTQDAALMALQTVSEAGNNASGGVWAQDADDKFVTAYQMFYQWVNGTGSDSRTFDQNSVMGQQMSQADYVQNAAITAAIGGGSFTFARQLANENPLYYAAYDFPNDVLGANPARGFQGSIVGVATSGSPTFFPDVVIVPVSITLNDSSTAVSGTRASATVGGYAPNPTAVYSGATGQNPYGSTGPLRTITETYNLTVYVSFPRNGSPTVFTIP